MPFPACRNGDVRLRGGPVLTAGRLEVCFGGQWGTVNDKGFSNENAQVVCRQLGYVSAGERERERERERGCCISQ